MSHLIPEDEAEVQSEETVESQKALTSEEVLPENADAEATEEIKVPDKYKGKSIEDVIAMHQNAEKEIGRQANEVGTYRELVSSLTDVKRTNDLSQADTTEETQPVEVTSDDLFDNPTDAIKRVVERVVQESIAPLQQNQVNTELAAEVQALANDFPDAEALGTDPEFNDFVTRAPHRIADATAWIETKDVNAARRLLTDFKEFKGLRAPVQKDEAESNSGVEAARKAATESGRSSSGAKSVKKLSKREVMKVFNNDRDRYDTPAFQKMLTQHARNGTLVD